MYERHEPWNLGNPNKASDSANLIVLILIVSTISFIAGFLFHYI